jgi:protein phosphatase
MASIRKWLSGLFGTNQEVSTPEEEAPSQDQASESEIGPDLSHRDNGLETDANIGHESTQAISQHTEAISRHTQAFQSGWLTDVGSVRGQNEDALLVFTGQHDANDSGQPIPPFGLFMVADGMGGHQKGEIASSLALRISASHLISTVYLPMLLGSERGADQPSLTDVVREAVSRANRAVARELPGSGSTLTCGLILGSRLFIGHVGDSRAYLLRNGASPERLTRDHSFVNRLIEMGQISKEEALVHPQRNVLYRAIGQTDGLEVDVTTNALQDGDRLFLCSDGLWNMMEEPLIWRILSEPQDPQEACLRLVEAANEAGGNDNVTVVYTYVNLSDL